MATENLLTTTKEEFSPLAALDNADSDLVVTEEKGGSILRLSKTAPLCQGCGHNPSKYKCPGCGFRSCCLSCVKAHKDRTSCNGKRDRTAFVPMSQYDENCLVSDYNLLEETLRQIDSAKRTRAPLGAGRKELGSGWAALRHQARNRKITLLFLESGMTRRLANSSYYCRRRKCIFWRLEWVFYSTDVKLVDHRVDENLRPASVLEKQLAGSPGKAIIRHQLRNYCKEPIENLRLLLLKEPCLDKKKLFIELDPMESLGSQLANRIVLEFPVIYVVLPTDTSNLVVVEDLRVKKLKILEPTIVVQENNLAISESNELEGIPYREEEIEEGEIVQ